MGTMRLRERKQVVNYDTSCTDDDDDCSLPKRRVMQDSIAEASSMDNNVDEEDIVEDSCEQGCNGVADKRERNSSRQRTRSSSASDGELPAASSGDPYATSNSEDEDDVDGDDEDDHFQIRRSSLRSRKAKIVDRSPSAAVALRKRSVRINYREDSCSDGGGYEEEKRDLSNENPCEENEHDKSDMSIEKQRFASQGDKGSNTDSDDVPSSSDFALEQASGMEKTPMRGRRRLIKIANRFPTLETKGFMDNLSSKGTGSSQDLEDTECALKAIEGQSLNEGDSGVQLRTYTRTRKATKQPGGNLECTSESNIGKAENGTISQSNEVSSPKRAPGNPGHAEIHVPGEIEFLTNTYVRKRKSPNQSTGRVETITNSKDPTLPKHTQSTERPLPKLKVDVFGPFTDEDESRHVVKKLGQVEKILSVKNRHSSSAVYCVKLTGKSYRNAVYVSESLLLKYCPKLLWHFLKRMDDLQRVDGNVGEMADGPAFNPLYIQVDRIVATEHRGRRKCYLVKWHGLPYSEATWEPEDDLLGDKKAIERFLLVNSKGAPTGNTSIFKDGRVLRDYQKKGLAWMDHNFQKQVNCILADEMGLGKTMQSVAMLQNLRVKWKIKGPFLVIAPVSTLGHWQREVESLTDMNCVVYSGSMEDRNIIRDYEFYHSATKLHDLKFNVLLTGYEILMKDHFFLSKHHWQYIIVDEAHRLKTKHSKTTRTLKQMSVRKGGLLLLTGTPVQNNTKEIFSLLNLLDPEQFNSEEDFLVKYGDIKNAEQVRDLQENILKPRLLRRMKEDVEKSIPLKEETIIWVELTQEQRSYYRAIYENRISDLLRGSLGNNIPNLRNVAMEIRKLCNHPFLCDGFEEDLISKYSQSGHQCANGEDKMAVFRKVLCQSSGKMLLLDKLMPMLKDAGRRVLIFSQFTIMLDLIEDYLNSKGYSYERIDGKIRGSDRQAAIDRYSARGSETFVFLLSTRAGGLGITLTAADTCIIYDSDWNPQNDLQAMARCHRIGQTKDVKIYRLITRNTYEQHLFECSSRKYGLDEAILGNILGASGDIEHNKNIESLLKRGAYDMLKDDGEAEAAAFHAQNIDQILEQRTQKRLIGGRGNNTFSVATFISNPDIKSDNLEDKDKNPMIDVDSVQFWQELLPEACHAALNTEKPQEMTSGGPRRRAQVNYKEKPEVSDEGSSDEGEKKIEVRKRHAGNKRNRDAEMEDGVKQWSEKELKRLENRFVMLGKGREEQVMLEAGLEHHGLAEVQQVADALFQLCLYLQAKENAAVSSKEVKSSTNEHSVDNMLVAPERNCLSQSACELNPGTMKNSPQSLDSGLESGRNDLFKQGGDPEILGDIPVSQEAASLNGKDETNMTEFPKIPSFAKKAMASQNYIVRLQKNASRYLQALHEREVLAKALSGSSFFPITTPRSKKLPLWWGEAEDLDLMRGALKHGHKDFSKIREDPSFCFAARLSAKKWWLDNQIPVSAENCGSGLTVTDHIENAVSPDQDEWPHDSILTSRLKKLIECLPNGLSDREIKRRAAVAEAARKRFQELRSMKRNQETVSPSQDHDTIQLGFVLYIDDRRFEQPEFRHVRRKADTGVEHPITHFSGISNEILNYPEYRTPIPSAPVCETPFEQESLGQILKPGTVHFGKPLEAVQVVGDSSLGNVTGISMPLAVDQPSTASGKTWPRLSHSYPLGTPNHELMGSALQHEFAIHERAQDLPLQQDSCTPLGYSGFLSVQGMLHSTGSSSVDMSLGSNEEKFQEYDLAKRKAARLPGSANKRHKEWGANSIKQEMPSGLFTSEFSTAHQEL